ncbi:MAG: argininosuccinate lyase [Euryarchaeota archaeon]|nr:argininosuccinate lyase [Euryarchaeota archaeon]MDE1835303.1 argininosuccinate lyase [Euryarchaeota archaeon]MDE1880574.1 argininosuccinate lyase [Euryarchaeota archaeon]MDE2043599.1 argininosuccinate lyase [Thermoplasmata archaeon]
MPRSARPSLLRERFRHPPHPEAAEFGASVKEDTVLLPFDLLGSLAHARMLTRQGLIPLPAGRALVRELVRLRREAEAGTFRLDPELEDVHMNVESALTARLGDVGARLPTGRSRNDQVATDLALYLRDALLRLEGLILDTAQALLDQAAGPQGRYVVPATTHLQDAQRVYLAQILQVHARRLSRDATRLKRIRESMVYSPLGAGAVAGSSLPLDRHLTARSLGFREPHPNAMDAVSDRDSASETLGSLAILGVHLSSLAEEWVLWSTPQVARIHLDDAFVTTSSLMPHKRNPDMAELLRGEAGPLIGLGAAHLITLKGLPLSYNRDLQTLKPLLFEGVRRAERSLRVLAPMARTARFHTSPSPHGVASPTASVELADELTRNGVPFREAHRRVARFLVDLEHAHRSWGELTMDEWYRSFPELKASAWIPPAPHQEPERRRTFGGSAWGEVAHDRLLLERALLRHRSALRMETEAIHDLERRLETDPVVGVASPRLRTGR